MGRNGFVATLAVVGLLGVMLVAGPTVAGGRGAPVLRPPVPVRDGVVRLVGRVGSARSVVLQRRRHGRWTRVRTLPVRGHRFSTTLRTTKRPQRLRVVAGARASRTRVVPSRPVPVAPEGTEPTPAPVDACGVRPVKRDGSWWSCTLADDFDGTELDRDVWVPQTVFATGEREARHACYRDHPDNIRVAGGALHLTLREEARPLPCAQPGWDPSPYTAGMVSTYRLFSQRHGRFEARLRSTASPAPGLQEAFWLWPDDRHRCRWPGPPPVRSTSPRPTPPTPTWPSPTSTTASTTTADRSPASTPPGTAGPTWWLPHLHARVVGCAGGHLRRRPGLPGQHLRRRRLPTGLHRRLHPGARGRPQRPRRHGTPAGHLEHRLPPRLGVSPRAEPPGAALGRDGTMGV